MPAAALATLLARLVLLTFARLVLLTFAQLVLLTLAQLVLLTLAQLVLGAGAASAGFELVETFVHPDGRDSFGQTLLVDGSRLYAAAPLEEPGYDVTHGSVYEIDLGGVAPMRRLVAPDTTGAFGFALAAAGQTLFVGAPTTRAGDVFPGAVHAFDLPSGAFLRSSVNPDPASGEEFGFALATGAGRLAIGAPYGAFTAPRRYVVRVYDLATGALEHTIENPDGLTVSFGSRLAIVGDLLLASGLDDSEGVVHVFALATGALVRTLRGPSFFHTGSFGWSLTPVAGLVAIGAPVAATDHGAVFLVDPATGELSRTIDSPMAAGAQFGQTVAALGDLLVIGAPGRGSAGSAALVYDPASGELVATLGDPSSITVGTALAATRNQVFVQAYRGSAHVVLRFASTCGNGFLDAGELCDDGNLVAGDGCTPACHPSALACGGGLGITRATLNVRTPADGRGATSLLATGRLDGMPEAGIVMMSVFASGARVRVHDGAGHELLDLSDLGTPIPGGRQGCGPRDGWRTDPGRHRAVYTNRSGALPPSCAPGSAQGLRRLELHRGLSRHRIDVRLKVAGGELPPPATALELIVRLGGLGDDVTTACGSRRFDAADCRGDGTGDALFCRGR